jgi:hypothetical protein
MYLLALSPLSLLGCYYEEHKFHDTREDCPIGVSFDLSDLQDQLVSEGAVEIRACFNDSCDELTLRQDRDQQLCEGAPGGPPDQLTWCQFHKNGQVQINILRVDGAYYQDQAPHTVALSIKDRRGGRLQSHVEVLRFGKDACGLAWVRVRAPEVTPEVEATDETRRPDETERPDAIDRPDK